MTAKPANIEHTTNHGYKVVLSDPKQLVIIQGIPCIDGGKIKHNGKMVALMVRYDDKPELAAKVEAWKAAWAEYENSEAAEFDRNVPGLDELRKAQDAAYNEQARFEAELCRMMDTGSGIYPKPIDQTLQPTADALSVQYPRAAMYLKAEGYTYSNNVDKYSAGKKAMELIATGGSLNEAEEILNNWTPESAIWN